MSEVYKREPPPHMFLTKAAEMLRKASGERYIDAPDTWKVAAWLENVAKQDMPGTQPDSITHQVDKSNSPTPLDKRPTQFFFRRFHTYRMKLVQEFGEKQIRTRVYEIEGDGFVVTRTDYNAWGEHHYDDLVNVVGGPIVPKEKAICVAKSLQVKLDEQQEKR